MFQYSKLDKIKKNKSYKKYSSNNNNHFALLLLVLEQLP